MTRQALRAFRGLTLIELMVTVAMLAILAYVATPNLSAFKRNAELTSATNALVGSLATARSEAMKRGYSAMIMPASGTSWTDGWVVFVDVNRNNTYDSSTDITLNQQNALPTYFSVAGAGSVTPASGTPYIMFDASGYARLTSGGFGASTFSISRNDLTGSALLEQTRRIKIGSTGRVRSCKPKSASDTDCSSSGS